MCWQLVVKELARRGGHEVKVNDFSDCLDEKARQRLKKLGLCVSHGKGAHARYSLTDLGKAYIEGKAKPYIPYMPAGKPGKAKGQVVQFKWEH